MGSPKKSMSRCTTLDATSGNLTAQLWMAATSICTGFFWREGSRWRRGVGRGVKTAEGTQRHRQ